MLPFISLTLLSFFFDLPFSIGQDYYKHTNCSQPFDCGSLRNISFPFWGHNRAEYCGHPGYKLRCEDDQIELAIETRNYRVLNIETDTQSLIIVPVDTLDDSCPAPSVNVSFPARHFNYSLPDTVYVTMYYNCPMIRDLGSSSYPCSPYDNSTTNYAWNDRMSSWMEYTWLWRCQLVVRVPILLRIADTIVSSPLSLQQVLREGFEVRLLWIPHFAEAVKKPVATVDIIRLQCDLCAFALMVSMKESVLVSRRSEQEYYKHTNCSQPFDCGIIRNISFPFWGHNRAEYCGQPGYELRCEDDQIELAIETRNYRVLNIETDTQSLNIVPLDTLDDSCPAPSVNVSFPAGHFNYSLPDTVYTTMYYNCPLIRDLGPSTYPCSPYDNSTTNYAWNDRMSSWMEYTWLWRCELVVRVPILLRLADTIVSSPLSLQEVLREGFEVGYTMDSAFCESCQNSGGHCGYNSSTMRTMCFCLDGEYEGRCPTLRPIIPRASVRLKVAIGASSDDDNVSDFDEDVNKMANEKLVDLLEKSETRRYVLKEEKAILRDTQGHKALESSTHTSIINTKNSSLVQYHYKDSTRILMLMWD